MITSNPGLVSDSLHLSYDINNPRSYKGPVVSNVATGITPRNIADNGTTYRFFSGVEECHIPSLGKINATYVDTYNDYAGGSGECCPSPFGYGNGISVTGSTVYTYGMVYRSVNRYTNPNLMYHYEFNSSGTYLTEFGVHNGGYTWEETHLGNGWYWTRAKFTTQPTAASINTGTWMYQYATWNRLYVAKVLIAPGDWMQLHPSLWPDVSSTRTNTQNIIDLTGNNAITANSLTYASNGTFSFNGTSDYITIPNSASSQFPHNSEWSIQFLLNIKSFTNTYPGIIVKGSASSSGIIVFFGPDGTLYFKHNNAQSSVASFTFNQPFMLTLTHSNGTVKVYKNGVYSANGVSMVSTETSSDMLLGKADERGNFDLYSVLKYSKELSAAEVKQNFNAQRGRYGL